LAVSMAMHTDDLSSDDDQENRNTVGRGESRNAVSHMPVSNC